MPLEPVQEDWLLEIWDSGKDGLEKLVERSRKSKAFAPLTFVFHGAPIDYERSQEVKDELIRLVDELGVKGLRAAIESNPEWFENLCKKAPRNAIRRCVYLVPVALECMERYEDLDDVIECMAGRKVETSSGVIGLGRGKTYQLVREYIGDRNAVAVDRHVYRTLVYLFDYIPRAIKKDSKTYKRLLEAVRIAAEMSISGLAVADIFSPLASHKKENLEAMEYVRELAREISKRIGKEISPAEIQVGLWLWSKCESESMPDEIDLIINPKETAKCPLRDLYTLRRIRKALGRYPKLVEEALREVGVEEAESVFDLLEEVEEIV